MENVTLKAVMNHPVVLLLIAIISTVGLIATLVALSPEQRIWTFGISLVCFLLMALLFWFAKNRAQSQKLLMGGLRTLVALAGYLMLLSGVIAYIAFCGYVYGNLDTWLIPRLFSETCQTFSFPPLFPSPTPIFPVFPTPAPTSPPLSPTEFYHPSLSCTITDNVPWARAIFYGYHLFYLIAFSNLAKVFFGDK